jgi:hypothetical protein
MPGRDIISGIIWWSISMKEMVIRTQIKTNRKPMAGVNPNFWNNNIAKMPVSVSIKGYLRDIGLLQNLQRPIRQI